MQKYLEHLVLVGFTIIIVGCNRSVNQPIKPNPTSTPATVLAPTSMESGALASSPLNSAASSPILVPTATPTLVPVATPTLPYTKRYKSDGTLIAVTPVPAAAQVTCMPQEEVIACYDDLLDMNFSYPTFMGEFLFTILRKGGYSGYVYGYAFKDSESTAGGRSRDFSEGRGPMYTDERGFNGRSPQDICAGWIATMCQELSPGALLIVLLPQAEWLCSDAMMFSPIPRAILVLDLPQHPLINGFSFSFELMSAEAKAAFRDEWYNDKQCEPETEGKLRTAMEDLQQDLQAGTASADIQHRYDAMIQLAKTIQSPYISTTP